MIAYPASTAFTTTPPVAPPPPPFNWEIIEEWWGEQATLYCNGRQAKVRNIDGFGAHFEVTEDGAQLCEGITPSLGESQRAAQAAIQ